jgi:transcriptional regulator with XRE-family HTH domain
MSKEMHMQQETKAMPAVDVEIGRRIKERRKEVGLSQEKLAALIGPISFQQLQKYEKGVNRVSCARIAMIATALEVPVQFFFPDHHA